MLKAAEPVLVDTGLSLLSDEFLPQLSSVIDPADLRWLWLTHADPDHIGCLHRLLDEAPNLRVITTFLRRETEPVSAVAAGSRLPVESGPESRCGRPHAHRRPPTFDAPETTGFYDPKSGAFFSADCFGALMSEPAGSAAEICADDLREGLVTWATVDSPWLHLTDYTRFTDTLNRIRDMAPKVILSSHLPVAEGMNEELLDHLAAARVALRSSGSTSPGSNAPATGRLVVSQRRQTLMTTRSAPSRFTGARFQ